MGPDAVEKRLNSFSGGSDGSTWAGAGDVGGRYDFTSKSKNFSSDAIVSDSTCVDGALSAANSANRSTL